tara:strand:- start:768 stop:1193 length:426 start_codon:yes stop_codon:yes gene_type:complete
MNNDSQIEFNEFKVLGLKMETFSIFYGLFLILWGFVITLISGSNSLTSYIPSFLGVPILVFSYLSIRFFSKKKLFMHIVVLFGLIIFIGGLDIIRSIIMGTLFNNYWADISKLMMFITGLYFTIQCIRSFIHARKNKEQKN